MSSKIRKTHTNGTKRGSAAILTLFLLLFAAPLAAQNQPERETVSVVGVGTATGAPDVAYVTLGVETRGQDVGNAIKEVDTVARRIVKALGKAGVREANIQTAQYEVRQEFREPPNPGAQERLDYVVSNIVEVKVEDPKRVAGVIDAGLGAGANRILNLRFDIENRDQLVKRARQEAIADAKTNARALAQGFDVRLGQPVHISEDGAGGGPFPQDRAYSMEQAAGPEIRPGQLTVTVRVEAVYALGG